MLQLEKVRDKKRKDPVETNMCTKVHIYSAHHVFA